MSSENTGSRDIEWRRLEEILQQALDRPPHEVDAFLDRVAADDATLGREVKSLLEASRQLSFLDSPALEGATAEPGGLDDEIDYEIGHELGRGGMGVVYYASRASGEPREAAIKFLDRPLGEGAGSSRFRQEREILSRLDHPNIARLLDGAQTPATHLVMEYVDGSRIDLYCEQQKLPVEERLRLFLSVCDAVHYAHQNLVIHCDIKPANILVDGAGQPRLLDFGIAKLLDDADGQTNGAHTSPRPLTLDYASPELIDGQTPTTASDVYSLGLVLCELLSGDVPCRLRGLSSGEIRRVLATDEPPLPSVIVAQAASRERRREVRCGLPAAALARRLEGDLDLIVQMALRFDPARRYASAAELARDVRRHLEGLPIHARPESLLYSARKLVRRHRLASLLAVLALSSIIAFGAAMAWQNTRILKAQERVERAHGESRAVGDFLVGLFQQGRHLEMSDGSMTADQLVDRGAEELRSSLPGSLHDQPATRAAVEHALGRLYVHLGRFAEARKYLLSALKQRREHGDPLLVAESLGVLGGLSRREARIIESRQHLEAAVALLEGQRGGEKTLSRVLLELAYLERADGRYPEAEGYFLRTLELRRRLNGDGSLQVTSGLVGLSRLYRAMGRYDEAERLLGQALSIQTEQLGPDHLLVGSTTNSLGLLLRSQGRYPEAEVALRRTIAIYRGIRGSGHFSLAAPKMNLAIVLGSMGDYERSIELFEQVLEIAQAKFEGPHSMVANAWLNLATAVDLSGDRTRAIELYGRASAAYEAVFGPEHETLGAVFLNLSSLYLVEGRLNLAESHVQRSLEIFDKALAADHDRMADGDAVLGHIAYFRGDPATARKLLDRAIAIYEKASTTHPNLHPALRRRGMLELDAGDLETARPFLERAAEICREALLPLHQERLRSEIDWAHWLLASERTEEAEALLRGLLEVADGAAQQVRGRSVFTAEEAAANLILGRLLLNREEKIEGRERIVKAVALLRSIEARTTRADRDLALALFALGERRDAIQIAADLAARGVRFPALEDLTSR